MSMHNTSNVCSKCHGHGRHEAGLLDDQTCRVCRGSGEATSEACHHCTGNGWRRVALVNRKTCRPCGGSGRARSTVAQPEKQSTLKRVVLGLEGAWPEGRGWSS